VVDTRNRFVYNIEDFLDRVTRPILMPIRRFLPNFGNLDLSPLLAILLLQALQIALADIYVHIQMAGLDY
jgi:YggT family protein